MRIPRESLDDFIRAASPKEEPQPPAKYVRFTGEIEVLKPLAHWDGVVKPKAAAVWYGQSAWYRLSSFHRSLAMGAVVTLIALVLGSTVFLRIDRSPVDQVTVSNVVVEETSPTDVVARTEPGFTSDLLTDDTPTAVESTVSRTLSVKRPFFRAPKARIPGRTFTAALQRVRHHLPNPQLWVSQFVPTTLVIFVEKGEIKTRIEPQSLYRKLLSN